MQSFSPARHEGENAEKEGAERSLRAFPILRLREDLCRDVSSPPAPALRQQPVLRRRQDPVLHAQHQIGGIGHFRVVGDHDDAAAFLMG